MKVQNVIHTGAAPGIDVLGIISDNCYRRGIRRAVKGPDEIVLCIIDILEFIYENPAEAAGPGAPCRCAEPVQCLQWQLIHVIDVC